MHRAHLTVLLACWLAPALWAQQVEVTRYDVDQGLPQSMVNHVVQDRDGFIWLGTGDGLARFDGQHFVVYKNDGQDSTSLSNNRIWGLAEADAHHLWVGTRSGLDRLDRRTGRFEHIRVGEPDGCWQVFDVRPEGSLFYSPFLKEFLRIDEQGTHRWPTGHWDSYTHRVEDDGRTIYQFQGHDTLAVSRIRDRTSTAIKLPMDITSEISSIIREGKGWLLFGQYASYRMDGQYRPVPFPAELDGLLRGHPGVKHAERAPDGKVWLGISGHGVVVLDSALNIVQRYPLLPPGQRPLTITAIAFDRQGNTWVGTDGKGVFKIAPQRIKVGRMMPGQGLPWEPASWFVRGFAQWDAHRVLVNFYQGGSALFDERTGTLSPAPLNARNFRPVSNHGTPLSDGEGRIWMQEGPAIRCVDPRTGQVVHQHIGTCGDRMVRLQSGELWRISTCKPPERLLPGSGPVHFAMERMNAPFTAIRDAHNMPAVLLQDGLGRYWMCSDALPITVFTEQERLPSPFGASDSLQLLRLTDLHEDGDRLWACTNDGLFLLERASLRILRRYTVHDGLPDQFLYGMESGGDDSWWISSNNGLCRFDPRTESFLNFSTADGLQSKEYNSHAHFRSASGQLYFGGVNGFNHFDPRSIPTDRDVPMVLPVALSDAKAAIPLPTGEGAMAVDLPYPRNTLRIELAVLEFSAPERNRYRWRMPGYREEWTTAASTVPIELNNVPAGSFTLEVIGINGDGVEGPVNTLLTVKVLRPFWAAPWFIALLSAALIALVAWLWALAYRKRMRARLAAAEQEMKELRLRTRLAKDIHDDVGSGLARVAALARSPKRVSDAESRFDRMEAISSELLDNLRDVVWMNDPRNGTLDLLLIRLREFAQDLFEDSDATVRCDFPDPLPATSIGGAFRRNLMLIGREALHNARKYSGARNITLMWRMEGDSFLFTVSDDGVGLGAGGVQGGGQGSGNMRQRAEEVHAQFERTDREGGGTEVRVFGRPSCLDE